MADETAVGRSTVTMIHIGQGVGNGKTIEQYRAGDSEAEGGGAIEG